jgi:hypothetical protein
MNRISLHRIPGASLLLVVALLSPAGLQASSKDSPAKAGRANVAIYSVPEIPFPPSVFVVPSQPSEGRNPFFPQSTTVTVAAPTKVTKENPIESFSFVLNGITSPPKRTAMINGRTFEPGEEGEVRLPSGGKILIKCVEIKADSAIIDVTGQRRELHLRSGF